MASGTMKCISHADVSTTDIAVARRWLVAATIGVYFIVFSIIALVGLIIFRDYV